jgi:DNA-binding NtrC family response regulator
MHRDKRLLIVDDDKIHRVIYSSIAAKMDYRVDLADSPATADKALRAAAMTPSSSTSCSVRTAEPKFWR